MLPQSRAPLSPSAVKLWVHVTACRGLRDILSVAAPLSRLLRAESPIEAFSALVIGATLPDSASLCAALLEKDARRKMSDNKGNGKAAVDSLFDVTNSLNEAGQLLSNDSSLICMGSEKHATPDDVDNEVFCMGSEKRALPGNVAKEGGAADGRPKMQKQNIARAPACNPVQQPAQDEVQQAKDNRRDFLTAINTVSKDRNASSGQGLDGLPMDVRTLVDNGTGLGAIVVCYVDELPPMMEEDDYEKAALGIRVIIPGPSDSQENPGPQDHKRVTRLTAALIASLKDDATESSILSVLNRKFWVNGGEKAADPFHQGTIETLHLLTEEFSQAAYNGPGFNGQKHIKMAEIEDCLFAAFMSRTDDRSHSLSKVLCQRATPKMQYLHDKQQSINKERSGDKPFTPRVTLILVKGRPARRIKKS